MTRNPFTFGSAKVYLSARARLKLMLLKQNALMALPACLDISIYRDSWRQMPTKWTNIPHLHNVFIHLQFLVMYLDYSHLWGCICREYMHYLAQYHLSQCPWYLGTTTVQIIKASTVILIRNRIAWDCFGTFTQNSTLAQEKYIWDSPKCIYFSLFLLSSVFILARYWSTVNTRILMKNAEFISARSISKCKFQIIIPLGMTVPKWNTLAHIKWNSTWLHCLRLMYSHWWSGSLLKMMKLPRVFCFILQVCFVSFSVWGLIAQQHVTRAFA